MKTLKQIFFKNQEKFIEESGDEEDIPYWVIEKSVKEWLQQKETDDFGGEMTASEFKTGLLEELENE